MHLSARITSRGTRPFCFIGNCSETVGQRKFEPEEAIYTNCPSRYSTTNRLPRYSAAYHGTRPYNKTSNSLCRCLSNQIIHFIKYSKMPQNNIKSFIVVKPINRVIKDRRGDLIFIRNILNYIRHIAV